MAGEKENKTQVLNETDDFEFGTQPVKTEDLGTKEKTEKVIPEEEAEKVEKVEKKEEKKEKAAVSTEKGKSAEKVKTKETEEPGHVEEEVVIEAEEDLFAPKIIEDKEKKSTVSFKNIAKKVDLDLEDDSEEEFVVKINDKIEKSKQELALDKFSPDAQKIIKHLNDNGGKIDDFFKNTKINSLQGIIGLNPPTKIMTVRIQELVKEGMEYDAAQEQASMEVEELTAKELRQAAQNIDDDAQKLIDNEISTIVTDREKFAEKERTKVATSTALELKQIKTYIEKQTDFLGIKLTSEAKKAIMSDIESGEFDTIANKNKAVSKFNAYMMGKFGTSIHNKIRTTISEKSREAYNEALDKSTGALHKTKEDAQRNNTGRQKSESGEKKNFDTWGDDLFESK